MPATTPKQKVRQVQRLGREWIEVELWGDTYDDAKSHALRHVKKTGMIFVPPFDHHLIMEGQATLGVEILQQAKNGSPTSFSYLLAGADWHLALSPIFAKQVPAPRSSGLNLPVHQP